MRKKDMELAMFQRDKRNQELEGMLKENKETVLYMEDQLRSLGVDYKQTNYNPIARMSFDESSCINYLIARDSAQYVARYMWKLPMRFTTDILELKFYQNGSLAMFIENDKVMFTKFAKTGDLNEFGFLDQVIPIDFAGKTYDNAYTVLRGDYQPKVGERVCLIIDDYTGIQSGYNYVTPRYILNKNFIIKQLASNYQNLGMYSILSNKKAIAIVRNDKQRKYVNEQVINMFDPNNPILTLTIDKDGELGNNIKDMIELFNMDRDYNPQNYLQAIDNLDKIRRSDNGIIAPSTMVKKERVVTGEVNNDDIGTNLILINGFNNRKQALERFKEYYPNNKEVQALNVEINPILLPQKNEEKPNEKEENENE